MPHTSDMKSVTPSHSCKRGLGLTALASVAAFSAAAFSAAAFSSSSL
jgi:hypothetical protein